jgi:hypothetical protein
LKTQTFLVFIFSLLLTAACTNMPFERSASSGYSNYEDFNYADVGDFVSSRSLTPSESDHYTNQSERKSLEARLQTPEEKKQYIRYRPYLNEEEKIEFLKLDDTYARERWIQTRGLEFSSERHSRNIASLIEENDIALGMQKEAVRDSWGDPDYVEVSGNPKFENERWKFSLPIQTSEGYQIEERLVYFESGRVVGWSSR